MAQHFTELFKLFGRATAEATLLGHRVRGWEFKPVKDKPDVYITECFDCGAKLRVNAKNNKCDGLALKRECERHSEGIRR